MENKNLYNSLRYGHIIKLISEPQSNRDPDAFFFVNNVGEEMLELTNERNENQILSLNDEGGLDGISEIVIVHVNNVGYAISNGLIPGKYVKIVFFDGVTHVEGEIVDLQEDMITVKTVQGILLYIDFEYRGIKNEYNIKEINVTQQFQNTFNGNNDIVEIEEQRQLEQREGFVYSFEQQIDDYIEKNQISIKNKKKVLKEISKYSVLLEEYTNVDDGVISTTLPENQILNALLQLQPGVVYPVTSYANKDIYTDDDTVISFEPDNQNTETTNWKYSVKIKDTGLSEEDFFRNNINFTNVKRMKNHKKVRVNLETRGLLVNKTMNPINEKPFLFSIQNNTSAVIPYDAFHIDKESAFVMDGIAFPSKFQLHINRKQHRASELLSKCNTEPTITLKPNKTMSMLTKSKILKKSLFHNSRVTFYPLKEHDNSFKEYLSKLKYRINDFYPLVLNTRETNYYSSLGNLAIFNISKLGVGDHAFILKHVRDNIKRFKREIGDIRDTLSRYPKKPKYKNAYNDMIIHQTIAKSYKIEQYSAKQPSELFDETMIDSSKLLLSHLKEVNKKLSFDIRETEIAKYIDEIRLEINGEIDRSKSAMISYAKSYENRRELLDDINKIILRNTRTNEEGILEVFDPLQHLQNILINKTLYTGNIKSFMENIDILLKSLYSNDHDFEGLKEIIFTNEDDKENIIKTLMKEIVLLKVRKLDKCYVKDENKYYTYDGATWLGSKEFDDKLGNKKMIKSQNSLDDLLPLKTKIIHDFVIDLVHKNEQITDKTDIERNETSQALAVQVALLRNQQLRTRTRYNSQKLEYGKLLDLSNDKNLKTIYSGFTPLLHSILMIDDLSKRYDLIQRFVSLFTIDQGDVSWYYCIRTKSKLVPKYLIKLCNAFHDETVYKQTINEICQNEGYLSEDGDAWIHKESGFTIKEINFDNNDFSENSFKEVLNVENNVTNEEIEIDMKVFDDEVPSQIIDTGDKKTFKRLKMIADLTLRIMNIIGMSFVEPQHSGRSVFEQILDIYVSASKKEGKSKTKDSERNVKLFIFAILSYVLVYAQYNRVEINSSFGKCRVSFQGYPMDETTKSRGGIRYLSCIMATLAEKYENLGTTKISCFKSMSKEEISDELVKFIKSYAMKSELISDMVWQGRIRRDTSPMLRGVANSELSRQSERGSSQQISSSMARFKPQLKNVSMTEKIVIPSAISDNIYIDYKLKKLRLDAVNMRIEAIINDNLRDEEPILKTQFEAPYVVNFCCNNKEFILDHLPKSKADRDALVKLLKESYDLQEMILIIENKYVNTSILRSTKDGNNTPIQHGDSLNYSKSTVFSYIESIMNFNNSKDIPIHLHQFGISKPDQEYYDRLSQKLLSTKEKIEVLEEKGYVFEAELMMRIMSHDHYVLAELQQTNTAEKSYEEENDVFDVFKSEFMATNDHSEHINLFDTNMSFLKNRYLQYVEDFVKSSDRRKIVSQLETWAHPKNTSDKEMIINQLYNINYALINTIPRAISRKRPKGKDIISKQWNLDSSHVEKIEKYYIKFYEDFDLINDDAFKNAISNIGDYQSILTTSFFNRNLDSRYYFLLHLFYKLVNIYIEERSDPKTTLEVNSGIIRFIVAYVKVNSFDYEKAFVKTLQMKNAEKRQKTDMLRNMRPQDREIEKQKMALKLGDWAYGNQKRVFKYYKELYQEDTERADKIKEIENDMYAEMITSGDVGEIFGGSAPPEMNMTEIPDADGLVYDNEGNEIDNYE